MSLDQLDTTEPSLVDRLRSEWAQRYAHQEHLFGALGVGTGQELVCRIQSKGPDNDALLYELVRLCTMERHDAALRVLFEAFTPLILKQGRKLGRVQGIGHINTAVATFWEVVSNFPLNRHRSIAGNIAGELIKACVRDFGAVAMGAAETSLDNNDIVILNEELQRGRDHEQGTPSGNAEAFSEVMHVLEWAKDNNVLDSARAAELGSYTVATREERHEMAERMGLNPTQLSKKINRYTRDLAKGIQLRGLNREALVA